MTANSTLMRKCRKITMFGVLVGLTLASVSYAQKNVKNPTRAKASSAKVTGKKVWDEWYTVTVSGKIHYGFYNERVELRDGGTQVFLKNEFWKQEENYINREDLGVLSQYGDTLVPMFFNFHSVYRTTETNIDGSVKDGKFLTVHSRRGGQDLPLVQRSIPGRVFFSTLFPVWLGRQLPNLKEGMTKSFSTILEDNIELEFAPMEGEIKLEKPDAFALENGVKRVRVDSRGLRSWWWVDERGAAIKIEMPEQKVVVLKASKAAAKKFLDGTI